MAKFITNNLYRITLASFLACLSAILGGCVITQLRLGLATDPLGPYVAVDYANPTGMGSTVSIGIGASGGTDGNNGPTTGPANPATTQK